MAGAHSAENMRKGSKKPTDDLRKEYDLSMLKNKVRGKYHSRAMAGSIVVLTKQPVDAAKAPAKRRCS